MTKSHGNHDPSSININLNNTNIFLITARIIINSTFTVNSFEKKKIITLHFTTFIL